MLLKSDIIDFALEFSNVKIICLLCVPTEAWLLFFPTRFLCEMTLLLSGWRLLELPCTSSWESVIEVIVEAVWIMVWEHASSTTEWRGSVEVSLVATEEFSFHLWYHSLHWIYGLLTWVLRVIIIVALLITETVSFEDPAHWMPSERASIERMTSHTATTKHFAFYVFNHLERRHWYVWMTSKCRTGWMVIETLRLLELAAILSLRLRMYLCLCRPLVLFSTWFFSEVKEI